MEFRHVEYSASVRCGAPRCSEPALWRFAVAGATESPRTALDRRPHLRCADHLSLSDLSWLPELAADMVVVVDVLWLSPAAVDRDDRSDTMRMASHLIDVDQLRPGRHRPPSVTGDATQLMPAVVPVPGQLLAPGTDR